MRSITDDHAEPELLENGRALALVDAELSRALHRECVTRDEAVQLLRDVQASVTDVEVGAKVASLVNDAVIGYQQDRLLDTHRVADALLDIRLLLTRGSSDDDSSELEAALVSG